MLHEQTKAITVCPKKVHDVAAPPSADEGMPRREALFSFANCGRILRIQKLRGAKLRSI